MRKCGLDLAPAVPWRYSDGCASYTRHLADKAGATAHWLRWRRRRSPETTSKIVSKSISSGGGRTSYRGLVRVEDDAHGCKSHVQCDALILDGDSVSDTYPYMEVGSGDAVIGHEATVSKVADDQLFYLQSRGLTEEQAMGLIVNGFIEPVTRTLPMEYAVEWSRLIELQMEGSVG